MFDKPIIITKKNLIADENYHVTQHIIRFVFGI